MKKLFTLALLAILGVGSAFAGDVTFVPSDFTPTDTKDYSLTKDGVTVEVKASTVNADQIRIYKGKTITISSTVGNITQAVFTCTAEGTAKYGPGCFEDATAGSYSYDAAVGTWTGDASEFTLTAKSNQVRATQIVVTIAEGGQVQTKTATAIEFSGDPDTRALADVPDVLKKSVPQAAVYAGETKISDADIIWNTSDASVTIDNNGVITATEQGTYTITASYSGNDTYKEASKSYTLKVYKVYGNLHNMVDDVTSGNEKWDTGELVFYMLYNHDTDATFSNTVAYVNGTSTYITDGTDFMLLYGTSGLTTGDVITSAVDLKKGTVTGIYGKLYRYNKQLPEISLDAIDVTTTATGAKVDPVAITVDKLGENLNHYVTIQDAEYVSADGKNLTFKVGETSFIVRQNWTNVSIEGLEVTAKYTLVGMESIYNTTNQLYLISWTKTSEPTGISTAKTAAEFNGAIYNVAGQQVTKSYKGLVIKNGKKVVQK